MKTLSNPVVIAAAIVGICAVVASYICSINGRYQFCHNKNGPVIDTWNGKVYTILGEKLIDSVHGTRKPFK